MKKIAIVVVTYNRKDCLIKNLSCLEKLNYDKRKYDVKFYIINNNSTDGTKELLEKKKNDKNYIIINLSENTGGAGGFYSGLKKAYDDGNDYIWGMDDDAYPDCNALKNLIYNYNIIDENCSLWSNCNGDVDFTDDYKIVNSWMFVGFFTTKEIIGKVGFPRKDFFIFFDDVEYCNRIISNGYKVYKIKDSIIEHKDSYSNLLSKKILIKVIQIPDFKDWKMYYYVRNKLLMYKKSNSKYWKTIICFIPKLMIKVLLIKPRQLKIVIKATFHGIRRKSGKIMSP